MDKTFKAIFKYLSEMSMWMRAAVAASVLLLVTNNTEMYMLVPICWLGYWVYLGAARDRSNSKGE